MHYYSGMNTTHLDGLDMLVIPFAGGFLVGAEYAAAVAETVDAAALRLVCIRDFAARWHPRQTATTERLAAAADAADRAAGRPTRVERMAAQTEVLVNTLAGLYAWGTEHPETEVLAVLAADANEASLVTRCDHAEDAYARATGTAWAL